MTSTLENAVITARRIRGELLERREMPRNLAGQCGLASMRVAKVLGDLRVLRVGFYMRRESFCGRRGRYPNLHAWCQVHNTIIDSTATQFGRHEAVHVVPIAAQDCYIETANARDALDEIMIHWRGRILPEYAQLAKALRRYR